MQREITCRKKVLIFLYAELGLYFQVRVTTPEMTFTNFQICSQAKRLKRRMNVEVNSPIVLSVSLLK